jgi:photosystem II stability/assembly factor-like uncharacterized protein
MKKLLLISIYLTAMTSQSQLQDFWTEYATAQPTLSTGVRSISIVDENTTWLDMRPGTVAASIRRYAKTVNGGTVWTTGSIDLGVDSINLEIGNIHGVSDLVAYAAAYPISGSAFGGIWKTADGGTTWTKQTTAAFSDLSSFTDLVYFWNANDGVAVGDAVGGYFEIYTTSNGGDLWTRVVSSPALVPLNGQEWAIVNNFEVRDNTIWVGTAGGRILKSVDKGLSWSAMQTPINDFLSAKMAFTDQNNGLVQTNNFQLYATTDGGVTWSEIINPNIRNFNIAAIAGMPNAYISIGEDFNASIRGSSFSLNGGLTWENVNDFIDELDIDGSEIAILDANNAFAGGFSNSPTEGGIFKLGDGVFFRLTQLAVSTFSDDKSITAFPNPTSGALTIAGKNINQIVVSDVLGKQIAVTNYVATDSASISLDSLAKGVYMLTVSNEKGTSVIKVVKQ